MSPTFSSPGQVDAALKAWWQGDCALGPRYFAYLTEPTLPVSVESQAWITANPNLPLVELDIPDGVMLITQTCDLRRDCAERPFLQVAPLVALSSTEEFADVVARKNPQYVTLPSLHPLQLVADLDRALTIEKTVVASWTRTQGCFSDEERRLLSQQLARKIGRAALPDEVKGLMKSLLNRWNTVKHRDDLEGKTFRDLGEVRIQATPSWYASPAHLYFWFILKDDAPMVDRKGIEAAWLAKLAPSERFNPVEGVFSRYELMKVSNYLDSDQVDLDRLSPD